MTNYTKLFNNDEHRQMTPIEDVIKTIELSHEQQMKLNDLEAQVANEKKIYEQLYEERKLTENIQNRNEIIRKNYSNSVRDINAFIRLCDVNNVMNEDEVNELFNSLPKKTKDTRKLFNIFNKK